MVMQCIMQYHQQGSIVTVPSVSHIATTRHSLIYQSGLLSVDVCHIQQQKSADPPSPSHPPHPPNVCRHIFKVYSTRATLAYPLPRPPCGILLQSPVCTERSGTPGSPGGAPGVPSPVGGQPQPYCHL